MFPILNPSAVFSPKQYSPLNLWLDAKDPAGNNTQPANASALATWVDKSGNGLNFTQATGALQPLFTLSAINSKPGILFNGSTKYMEAAFNSILNPAAGEIFVVCQVQGSAGNFRTPYASRTTGGTQKGFIFYATAGNIWEFDYGAGGAGAVGMTTVIPTTVGTPRILDAQINNSAQTFYINGVSQATSAGAFIPNIANVSRIGAINETSPTFYFNGYVSEILIYGGNLSSTQRTNIYSYLSGKWGI